MSEWAANSLVSRKGPERITSIYKPLNDHDVLVLPLTIVDFLATSAIALKTKYLLFLVFENLSRNFQPRATFYNRNFLNARFM